VFSRTSASFEYEGALRRAAELDQAEPPSARPQFRRRVFGRNCSAMSGVRKPIAKRSLNWPIGTIGLWRVDGRFSRLGDVQQGANRAASAYAPEASDRAALGVGGIKPGSLHARAAYAEWAGRNWGCVP